MRRAQFALLHTVLVHQPKLNTAPNTFVVPRGKAAKVQTTGGQPTLYRAKTGMYMTYIIAY